MTKVHYRIPRDVAKMGGIVCEMGFWFLISDWGLPWAVFRSKEVQISRFTVQGVTFIASGKALVVSCRFDVAGLSCEETTSSRSKKNYCWQALNSPLKKPSWKERKVLSGNGPPAGGPKVSRKKTLSIRDQELVHFSGI